MKSKIPNSFCNIKLITGIKMEYGQNSYVQHMKAMQDTYFRRLLTAQSLMTLNTDAKHAKPP
jgi:hypothetical protein